MYIVYLKENNEIVGIYNNKPVAWTDDIDCVEGTYDDIITKNGVQYYKPSNKEETNNG